MTIELANKTTLNAENVTRQYSDFTKKFTLNISFGSNTKLEDLIEKLTPEACAVIGIPDKNITFKGYTVLSSLQERYGDGPDSTFVTLSQADSTEG